MVEHFYIYIFFNIIKANFEWTELHLAFAAADPDDVMTMMDVCKHIDSMNIDVRLKEILPHPPTYPPPAPRHTHSDHPLAPKRDIIIMMILLLLILILLLLLPKPTI